MAAFMITIILTVAMLSLMEVALSFDNAIINAKILQNMSALWQKRFLTWGILVAVAGMRLVFPILIVCVASGLGISAVVDMAINNPTEYGNKLQESHIEIAGFGGMFLLMVFFEFMFDPAQEREVFWLEAVEKKLASLGLLKGMEIITAAAILLGASHFLPNLETKLALLNSGFLGIGLYMFIQAIMGALDTEGACLHKQGFIAFIYLEILDASCSFDGVIGAFALTSNIAIIMLGLGIGAFAVRSLTLYLVKGGVLSEYIYLEHGAHYGIGALASIMLVSIFIPVPEIVTGSLGIGFIGLSLLSSIKHKRTQNAIN